MKKIILSGYMGSGKSTIARLLHERKGIEIIDLDELIEARTNQSIAVLFASKGELYFRKLEHNILKEILSSEEGFVLSLGGGTPCYANNHQLLKGENITSIYLKALPETLYQRLAPDMEKRPLIAGKSPEGIKEFIAMHLFDRSFYYNQADYKIDTDNKSPETIVREIENLLA